MVVVLISLALEAAGDEPGAPYAGRQVASVLDEFRSAGVEFVYSTNVVSDDLYVAFEPEPGTPLEIVRQILKPHRLAIRGEAGVYIIVRDSTPPVVDSTAARDATPSRPEVETVVVSASRYEISRDMAGSSFSIDQRTIQNLPDIGEDPIRATQRLPGTAASGASAQTHFRGGEQNEVGIMLNGLWLFDPFHIRDYQNIFSTIDARAIDGVEVYTGGFPARYGDRMSGLILMNSLESENSRHNEIGISVFNTSFLTVGNESGHGWLFSARRGNLDLVIDPKFGSPSYFDVFGEYTFDLGANAKLSINALYADDLVELVLETDPEEREQVTSDTQNAQIWLRLESNWSPHLASHTVLSFVDYQNRRDGIANDPSKFIADTRDHREVQQIGLRQDWIWKASDRHRMQWGFNVRRDDAWYSYDGNAQFFGLPSRFNRPNISRSETAAPAGGTYALWLSDRWRIGNRATLEWGIRWDDQTYTNLSSDSQLSPRFSFLFRPWTDGELRVSLGRYHQSQSVQSLQIEDGIATFWPAQQADHFIVGFHQQLREGLAIRAELFHKEIRDPRPRFENLHDPLGIMPELQADRVRLDPTRARAQGFEISVNRSRGVWDWWATYTLSEVTDRIDGRDEPRSWDQRHAFQGGFGWHDERWQFSAAASVHSGWPTTDLTLDADGMAVPGRRNDLQLPTFASVDLRLSRKFDVPRGSLTAFVEISNAFNRRNVCCIDWDIEESPDGGDVLERSLDYWMPLLPAIGILWEF